MIEIIKQNWEYILAFFSTIFAYIGGRKMKSISIKQAGYPDNDVPASISSDAIANGYSNTIACDIILDMANNWRSVQMALRSNRLLAKANTKNATTNEELDVAEQTWDGFLAYIKQQIS